MKRFFIFTFLCITFLINADSNQHLLQQMLDSHIILHGNFTLKSGATSSLYIDMRKVISCPNVFKSLINELNFIMQNLSYDHICGVPYGAVPLATGVALYADQSQVMLRKEIKSYGTQKLLEGNFIPGQTVLLIEDVITTGSSIQEAIDALKTQGAMVKDIVVVIDRQQGGVERLQAQGYNVHVLFTLDQINTCIQGNNHKVQKSVGADTKHPVLQKLFNYMDEKETNLCLVADVAHARDLLILADQAGPHICILKTHIDMLTDFDPSVITTLRYLADKHHFLIMEDRKFADIGKTACAQYCHGIYNIAEWADIITVHAIAGSGMIDALKKSVDMCKHAAIIVANMSTTHNLTNTYYTKSALNIGYQHHDFVIGFVGRHLPTIKPSYIILTPGISLDESVVADQHYITPEQAIEQGTDILVVGQAICASENIEQEAQKYQRIGWAAYQKQHALAS